MKNIIRISGIVLLIFMIHSCKKNDDIIIKDIDGNVYTSDTIGTQVWMVENLKTTKYSNGDLIGTTTPATLDITAEATPKYQWASEGNKINVATYGRLYTWYTVNDIRGVCPTGWHVPTNAEWTTLTTYLGGEDVAGGKLKETGTTHWLDPNRGATNESGFTALPGSLRWPYGAFSGVGAWGNWWSSTEYSSTFTYYRTMGYDNSIAGSLYTLKSYGLSVRCLRD